MIGVNCSIQGTISSGLGASTGFTPVPYPIYMNGAWRSSVSVQAGLYNTSANDIVVSQVSTDNGEVYTVTNTDENYANATAGVEHDPIPTFTGLNIIGRVQGIWVYYKNADTNWVQTDLSSIQGGTFGGGSLLGINFDTTNNEFIVAKTGIGSDILTTTDFINFNNVTTEPNPVTVTSNDLLTSLFNVINIGGTYLAYGSKSAAPSDTRVCSSTDLLNWTLETPVQPSNVTSIYKWNNRYYIYAFDNNTGITSRTLRVWHSSDGINWTEVTMPTVTGGGEEPYHWLATSTRLYLIGASFNYYTTSTTFTQELPKNYLNSASDGSARGRLRGNTNPDKFADDAPDHIAFCSGQSFQKGGKVVKLLQANSAPTLLYPSVAPDDEIISWAGINELEDNSHTLVATGGTKTNNSLYARNEATTRYYEVTILATASTLNKIGARIIGDDHIADNNLPATDKVRFFLAEDTIETPDGANIAVTYTPTVGQVLGFLFDWTAQTCVISVDGTTLDTVPNINNTRSWIIEGQIVDGRYNLNVGQEAFLHNSTGATAWKD